MLGRAKSCRWQVFVRRRPPKQGELRTDVSKATMFQGDRAAKGFNFVSGKLLFEWADSRFGKPRTSRKGTVLFFSLVRKEPKVPQRFANLWTPGTIQISARYMIFAEVTGHHHVTGGTKICSVTGYRR